MLRRVIWIVALRDVPIVSPDMTTPPHPTWGMGDLKLILGKGATLGGVGAHTGEK